MHTNGKTSVNLTTNIRVFLSVTIFPNYLLMYVLRPLKIYGCVGEPIVLTELSALNTDSTDSLYIST